MRSVNFSEDRSQASVVEERVEEFLEAPTWIQTHPRSGSYEYNDEFAKKFGWVNRKSSYLVFPADVLEQVRKKLREMQWVVFSETNCKNAADLASLEDGSIAKYASMEILGYSPSSS